MTDRREPNDPLAQREVAIATAELELSLAEAQIRSREAMVEAHRSVLHERAHGLDMRERQARDAPVVGALAELEADVQVERAGHLHHGRRALAKAREDWLDRRRHLLETRRMELEAVEQGLARAQLRLDGRERRLHDILGGPAVRPQAPQAVSAVGSVSAMGSVSAVGSISPAGSVSAVNIVPPPAKASTHHGIGLPLSPMSTTAERVTTRPLGTDLDDGRTSRNLHGPAMRPAAMTPTPSAMPAEVRPRRDDTPHATTQTMLPEEGESLDLPARPKPVGPPRKSSRPTVAPVLVAPPRIVGVPDDLPDAVPPRLGRSSQTTTPFVPGLTLDGQPVVRAQLQVDRGGELLLVSFRRGAPNLESAPVLAFQSPAGAGLRFQVELRKIVPAPEGGAVAVLSTEAWDAGRREAFERALALLP